MEDSLNEELDRRLAMLELTEHQGDGIDRIAFLQVTVLCWLLPALLLIWGA